MRSKHLFAFFCLVYLILSGIDLRAQVALDSIPITGDWESAGYLIDNTDMRVEIEYKLQKNSCDATGFVNQQFRFRIEALKKPIGFDRFLSFKIMFEDCSGVTICKTVNLNVGVRQRNDVWDGIQPLSDPNSDNSFSGRRLIKAFYDVNLRWEKDPTKDSECQVVKKLPPPAPKPEMAKSIGVIATMMSCPGQKVSFYPVGGKKSASVKYHWTKSSCEGEQVWIGDTLTVSPLESTKFFVHMVGVNAPKECVGYNYIVNPMPVNNLKYSQSLIPNGGGAIVTLINDNELKNLPVSWYWDKIDPAHKFATTYKTLIDYDYKPGRIYFFRFENTCGASNAQSVSFEDKNDPNPFGQEGSGGAVQAAGSSQETKKDAEAETTGVKSEEKPAPILPKGKTKVSEAEAEVEKKERIYLGGGIISGGSAAVQPFTAMLGVGGSNFKGYVRYKQARSGTLGTVSPTLEMTNAKITNYPVNTNTYYVINGKVATQRVSITGGAMVKLTPWLHGYIGGGVGDSQVYWNAETYGYASPGLLLTNTWVKNKVQTAKGIEGEAGVIIKLGMFNLQGGVNAIKGDSGMSISLDVGAGIGITF